jgi:hypothetical protein
MFERERPLSVAPVPLGAVVGKAGTLGMVEAACRPHRIGAASKRRG